MPLIIIFAVELGWFPTSGMLSPGRTLRLVRSTSCSTSLAHLVLPLATVSLGLIGGYSILMRSSIIETRERGLRHDGPGQGPDRPDGSCASHAFPNALLPTVTVIAINLGYVVAGAITAEIVFNWPGLGHADRRRAQRPRLPGPAGHLPAHLGRRDRGQPRRRPRSTAGSTRGSGRERHGDPGRRPRRALAPAGPQRPRLRPALRQPHGRGRRAGDPARLRRAGALPGRCSSGRSRRRRRRPGTALEPPSARPPLRDRRPRPRHAQPDRPRRADLDDDRLPGDADHDRHRRGDRDRRRASAAAGSTRS